LKDYYDTPICKQGIYLNSEYDTNQKINSIADLISHLHDYPEEVFSEKKYIRTQKRIVDLKKIPQFEQKSEAWLKQRETCLSATAIATALDEDPHKYPAQLLLDKTGRGEPFVENEFVHHGKKYEDVGEMFYSFRNNVMMGAYGLIKDEEYTFIGASPDGICEKNTFDGSKLTKLVGRMLEIKFPKVRQILTKGQLNGDICPRQYYLQCLTQMYVTKMDECDFLQCKMEEYENYEDYMEDSIPDMPGISHKWGLEKGCLIQLFPKKMINGDPKMCLYNSRYIYPPKLHMTNGEIEGWIAKEVINYGSNDLSAEYVIDKIIYWKFTKITCNLIKADTEYMESIIPTLKQFWKYVEFYREYPDKLNRLETFIKEVGCEKSADIFEKVNKDYLSVNKKSKFKPLYQEENKWRKRFNADHQRRELWKKRNNYS